MDNIKHLLETKGTPLSNQLFTWKELITKPISKLNDDALTRLRIISMIAILADSVRFKHIAIRMNQLLRVPLAQLCAIEQHQATMLNNMISVDHAPLELTIAYEQLAIEMSALIAQNEPDAYQAQAYRFALLEDLDHLYRYAALLDRMEGKDANNILQGYTDIIPGRLTSMQHRIALDNIRKSYQGHRAKLRTKVHAIMMTAIKLQMQQFYMMIPLSFADPLAKELYAEIASIEAQHIVQYSSLSDANETILEKLLLHKIMEIYNYANVIEAEENVVVKTMVMRFLDYALGQNEVIVQLAQQIEPSSLLVYADLSLPLTPLLKGQRDFIREVLEKEINLCSKGNHYVEIQDESRASINYRNHLNADGSGAEIISAGYQWSPGTELQHELENIT